MVVGARFDGLVDLESGETIYANLDGVPISGTEVDFLVVLGALMMHLPEASPLPVRGE